MHLTAIDGANPLGFLAAIGTLRLATHSWPEREVKLSWQRTGNWSPVLHDLPVGTQEELCAALLATPAAPMEVLGKLGANITVSPEQFGQFLGEVDSGLSFDDRRAADFACAFGSEACVDDKGERIRYTSLCFITGSGHQDFLGTMKALMQTVSVAHLQKTLFGIWDDAEKGLSFRWSPSDARSYALRWKSPGPEGAWTNWGANRLAFEALPLLPALPIKKRLKTTGFTRFNGQDAFTWPIWSTPLALDEVASLLARRELQRSTVDEEGKKSTETTKLELRAIGCDQVFRAARVRIGQGANFKTSFLPSRAL